MAIARRVSRPRFTLVVLSLLSVTLLTVEARGGDNGPVQIVKGAARDVYAPIQAVVDGALEPVKNAINGIRNYDELKDENQRLRQQLEDAQGSALSAADAERERRALLDLYQISYLGDIPRVGARVIASTSSNFERTISIDKGSSHGLAVGMPVVTGAGLVGRIVEVSDSRSTVLLVTDPSSAVGVRVATTGDVGVAKGTGPGNPMNVSLLDNALPVNEGEVLMTSGLQDGAFPAQIPVGVVASSSEQKGELERHVTLDPVVDVDHVEFVLVLQWAPAP